MSYVGLGATTDSAAATALADQTASAFGAPGTTAYRVARGATLWSGRLANAAVNELAKSRVGLTLQASNEMSSVAFKSYQKIASGEIQADASGVVDIAIDTAKFLDGLASFSKATLSGTQAGAVVSEVIAWGQVAAGCAAGIAGAPGWGHLACGVSIIGKLFGDLLPSKIIRLGADEDRTIFAPNAENMPIVAADALRLAQVLRHYYGINSYAELITRLNLTRYRWLTGTGYTPRPVEVNGQLGVADKPVGGHNLRTILQMMDLDAGDWPNFSQSRIEDPLAFIALVRGRKGLEPSGRPLFVRFNDDHDISQTVVGQVAEMARAGIVKYGKPEVSLLVVMGDGPEHVTAVWPKFQPYSTPLNKADLGAFQRVDELINFFGAVTRRELTDPNVRFEIIERYQFGERSPVLGVFVRDHDRSGEPDAGPQFGKRCWTNLARTVDRLGEYGCDKLNDRLAGSPSDQVLREAGAIRLMAAFSYIHMQHVWSSSIPANRRDPISDVSTLNPQDDADLMRLPIDPRAAEQRVVFGKRVASWTMKYAAPKLPETEWYMEFGTGAHSQTEPLPPSSPGILPYELAAQAEQREKFVREVLARKKQMQLDAIRRTEEAWSATFGRPLTSYELAEIRRKIYGIEVQTTAVLPQDVYKLAQKIIGQTASTLALKDPMRKLDLRLERPGIGVGGAVLLGAAALLALKFLK